MGSSVDPRYEPKLVEPAQQTGHLRNKLRFARGPLLRSENSTRVRNSPRFAKDPGQQTNRRRVDEVRLTGRLVKQDSDGTAIHENELGLRHCEPFGRDLLCGCAN